MARKLARKCDSGSDGFDGDGRTDEETGEGVPVAGQLLNRREYVKLGVAATAAIGMSTGLGSAAVERHGISFENVLDAVDDLGMDPSGSDPIDPQVGDIPADTLVEFPDGEYLFTDSTVLARKGAIGFYGKGDATLKTAADTNTYHLNIVDTDAILMEGFTLDQTADNCCYAFRLHPRKQLYVGDVEAVGRGTRNNADGKIGFNLSITEPDGFGLVERWTDKKGSTWAAYNEGNGRIGSYSGSNHEGTLRFVDCDLREFGNNALYSSRTASTGNIQVEDSYFENNNAGSIRISGDGSYADNCTIVLSEELYTGPRDDYHESSSFAHRPIVIEQRTDDDDRRKEAGVEIRNTEIRIEPTVAAFPPIHAYPNSRSILVDNCHIEVNGPIKGSAPSARKGLIQRGEYRDSLGGSYPPGEPPRWLRMYDTTIVGAPEDIETTVFAADAGGTEIGNCWIELDTDANGISIVDSEGCSVEDTNIVVGGNATVFDNSDVETHNITHETEDTTDGGSDDGSSDGSDEEDTTGDEWQSFVINGLDSDTTTEYEFIVDGEARENTELSEYGTVSTVESTDDGKTRVAGTIRSGTDAFDYDGCIESYTAGSDVKFERDGVEITRDEIVDCELQNTLAIVGIGTTSSFDFTVDGNLAPHPDCEISCEDSISGSSAEDAVSSETAKFQFDGEITDFSLDGDAGVYVNGKQADPELLGIEDDPFLGNWITVDGQDGETTYQFSVTGDVYKSPDLGSVEAEDAISNGKVTGSVDTDVDGYRFSGELKTLQVEGTADLQFDEE